jgi:NAD(P)-dependent dehydrogenase (short-subunit alcohol dehydrogenase family)
MRHRYEDRVALVTGSTAGIGAATARRLAAKGVRVLVTGHNTLAGERVAAELGRGSAFVAGDLADPETPERLVAAALERHGRLDLLVNNAALDHTGDLLATPLAEVRALFEVNVFAAIGMLQAAGRAMADRGGAIVNVTSRLASIGVPTMTLYSASKGAMLALTRAAAVELAPRRVRVNAVAPGMTRTPLYEAWLAQHDDPDALDRATRAKVPQGRLAAPDDVAAAIAFLGSDEAAHVTGASLPVDGGYTAA